MKYCILTSNQPRHEAFVSTMSKVIKPSFVVREKKPAFEKTKLEKEKLFFSDAKNNECNVFDVESKEINSEFVESLFDKYTVDVCLVFGTSLLKRNILRKSENFLNIHTGLTQYYRGVESTFWALHDEKPERIGVTVHKMNLGIDRGKIYKQSKVKIQSEDDIDSLFFKSCKAGFQILKENLSSIEDFIRGGVKLEKEELGKLYKKRDVNENLVKKLNENYNRIIKNYIDNKDYRDKKLKLITG